MSIIKFIYRRLYRRLYLTSVDTFIATKKDGEREERNREIGIRARNGGDDIEKAEFTFQKYYKQSCIVE